jgi:SNF2 family DNA or RNA helicase
MQELYAMVNFCNPGVLGPLNAFKRIFQAPIIAGREKDATRAEASLGAERSSELARQLAQFVLRRTSEILEKILPPKGQNCARFCIFKPCEIT